MAKRSILRPTVIVVPAAAQGRARELEIIAGAGVTITATQSGERVFLTVEASGGGAVASVFGRAGAVVAQGGDYTAGQVGADAAGTATALVAAEAGTRAADDTALAGLIASEAGTRAAADTAEAAARAAADALLVPKSTLTAEEDLFVFRGGVVTRLPKGAARGMVPMMSAAGIIVWTALSFTLALCGDPCMTPIAQQGSAGRTT